ncbi:MAG: hypothetical protein LPL29_14975 [Alphaproteobacteria bacterium]|nr:hypothetical protein [Alphaproteobacteria bacterium]
MATWPLYHFDDEVVCSFCENPVGNARDGTVVGFGDGEGNRELHCPVCEWVEFFDVTKSVEKARKFRDEHADLFAARMERLRESDAIAARGWRAKFGKTKKRSKEDRAGNSRPPRRAEDASPGGAFDLTDLE